MIYEPPRNIWSGKPLTVLTRPSSESKLLAQFNDHNLTRDVDGRIHRINKYYVNRRDLNRNLNDDNYCSISLGYGWREFDSKYFTDVI